MSGRLRPIEGRSAERYTGPLSAYLNLVLRAGCALEELVEPGLEPSLAKDDPSHERNVHVPSFLVVAARKRWPAETC
jgi:hypothetical protein